jgi:ribosomal protein S27E
LAITVNCPHCSSRLTTDDSKAGLRAKCPKCGGVLEIPRVPPPADDEILEAELDAPRAFDDDELALEAPPTLPTKGGGDTKQCPVCGEMIQKAAIKCRFCGEIFDPVLKKSEQKAKRHAAGDEDMSTGDWVVAILCSGIGCIAGIVWMLQGKPKGKKMFFVSLIAVFIWGVINTLLETIARNQ